MIGGCKRTIQVYKPSEAISQAQIVSGSCPDQAHDVVSSTGGMDDGDGWRWKHSQNLAETVSAWSEHQGFHGSHWSILRTTSIVWIYQKSLNDSEWFLRFIELFLELVIFVKFTIWCRARLLNKLAAMPPVTGVSICGAPESTEL